MGSRTEFKTTFEPERIIEPIYTGGSVDLDQSGRVLATCLGEDALLSDLNTGEQLARIEGVRLDCPLYTVWLHTDSLVVC